jgi:hypothetical protein
MTGQDMLAELKGVPVTPVMLLADKSGNFAGSFRGYVPVAELAWSLVKNHGINCKL